MISIKAIRQAAQHWQWIEVTPHGFHRVLSFKSRDERINVYPQTGTIIAFLKHPDEGKIQLVFPASSLNQLIELLENPRLVLSPSYPASQDKPRVFQIHIADGDIEEVEDDEYSVMASYRKALEKEQARIRQHRITLIAHMNLLNSKQDSERLVAEFTEEIVQGNKKDDRGKKLVADFQKMQEDSNPPMNGNEDVEYQRGHKEEDKVMAQRQVHKEEKIEAHEQAKEEGKIEAQEQTKEEDKVEVSGMPMEKESKWTGAQGTNLGEGKIQSRLKRDRQIDVVSHDDGPKKKKARKPKKSILEEHGSKLAHILRVPKDLSSVTEALDKLGESELANTQFFAVQPSDEFPIIRRVCPNGTIHGIGRTFSLPKAVEDMLKSKKARLQAFAFESRKRYLIQWEDGTRINKGHGMDSTCDGSNVELVALGPDDSFFIKFANGEMESAGLPPMLVEVLNEVRSGIRSPVKFLSLGTNGKFFICHEDGKYFPNGLNSEELALLQKLRSPIREILFTNFGMIVRYNPRPEPIPVAKQQKNPLSPTSPSPSTKEATDEAETAAFHDPFDGCETGYAPSWY